MALVGFNGLLEASPRTRLRIGPQVLLGFPLCSPLRRREAVHQLPKSPPPIVSFVSQFVILPFFDFSAHEQTLFLFFAFLFLS